MQNLILALDPGRTTGFALARITGNTVEVGYSQREFKHDQFWTFVNLQQVDHVVCESFEYRRQDNVDLYPCELIGVLELAAEMGFVDVKYQKPKQAVGKNAAYRDEVLKRMNLFSHAPHGRDACRHLLVWLNHGAGYKYLVGIKNYQFKLLNIAALIAQ